MSTADLVKRWTNAARRHPIVAGAILASMVLGGIASTWKHIADIASLMSNEAPPRTPTVVVIGPPPVAESSPLAESEICKQRPDLKFYVTDLETIQALLSDARNLLNDQSFSFTRFQQWESHARITLNSIDTSHGNNTDFAFRLAWWENQMHGDHDSSNRSLVTAAMNAHVDRLSEIEADARKLARDAGTLGCNWAEQGVPADRGKPNGRTRVSTKSVQDPGSLAAREPRV